VSLVRYDSELRRVWLFNCRIHHGLLGLALFVVGLTLMADDWRDRPWLSDDPHR
jgi:hypothetical protein